MPSALYLAPAAGGKTAYLVTRARALAQGLRVTPRIVVPTQLQARAWKQRLAEAGGAMGVRVGTFDTLYRDILDATGETIIHLSEPVQYRLLRTIIANTDLSHYASLRAMPGFVQAVQTLIRELKAGGIEPEAFATAVASMGNEPRLAELARLYFVYQNQLQAHNWADSSGTGWLAAESLARHHAVGRDWPALFVDGFDDLTTVQQRVLQELAPRVGEFIITLTGAPGVQARELVHKRFSRTQQSLENDLGLHPKPLPNNTGPTQAPELAHLASTFLANAETVSLPAGKALTLIAAADREGEVRAALRWLKQRCVHDGLRLGEVALLARNCTPYRPFILQIAAEFGMPVHIVAGLPLRQNPAVTALLDLLRLILPEAPLAWRLTVSAWRSPYFDWEQCASEGMPLGINTRTAEMLEQVARWGSVIQGREQWNDALALLAASDAAEDLADTGITPPGILPTGAEAVALRAQFFRFVKRVTPPAGPQSCRTFVVWLETLIGDFDQGYVPGIPNDVDDNTSVDIGLVRNILAGPPDLAVRDLAALNAFKDVLRSLVWAEDAIGCTPMEFADFFTDVHGAVESAAYHLPLPAIADVLLVADVIQARGLAFRAAAIMGLAEGEFPATLSEDPLLRDSDRQRLRDDFNLAVELTTDSAEAEYAYEALTRANQALLLTRPRIADNGTLWQASPYWEEVRRRVTAEPMLLTATQQPAVEASASDSELLLSLAAAGALFTETAFITPARAARAQRATGILRSRSRNQETSPYEGDLSTRAAVFSQRYGPDHRWSASRLEAYRTCPFLFFFGNVLQLEARQTPTEGLDARQLGNIYHHIFERLYGLVDDAANLDSLLEQLPAAAKEILDAAPRREQFRPTAWWQQTRAEIIANVERSLIALADCAGDFVPVAHEAAFGLREKPPLRVTSSTGDAFLLHGLIDRVEQASSNRVRIIDYKTAGKSAFTNRAVSEGKKLQLPLYALAAQDVLGLGTVVDGFYWHIQQAERSSFTLSRFAGGPDAALETAVYYAWEVVTAVRTGRFVPEVPKGGCPSYCPAAACCWRYTPQQW